MQNSLVYKRTVGSSLFLADGVSAKGFLNKFFRERARGRESMSGREVQKERRSGFLADAGPSPRTLGTLELKVLLNGATQVPLMFCVLILVFPWLFKGIMQQFLRKSLSLVNSERSSYGGPSFEGRYGDACKIIALVDFVHGHVKLLQREDNSNEGGWGSNRDRVSSIAFCCRYLFCF